MSAPARTLRELCARLRLPVSPEFEKLLAREEARSTPHETGHRYNLEEFGLDGAEIETRLAGLFERFAWPREAT